MEMVLVYLIVWGSSVVYVISMEEIIFGLSRAFISSMINRTKSLDFENLNKLKQGSELASTFFYNKYAKRDMSWLSILSKIAF